MLAPVDEATLNMSLAPEIPWIDSLVVGEVVPMPTLPLVVARYAEPATVKEVEDALGILTLPVPKLTGWLLVVLTDRVEPESMRYAPDDKSDEPLEVAVPAKPALVPK